MSIWSKSLAARIEIGPNQGVREVIYLFLSIVALDPELELEYNYGCNTTKRGLCNSVLVGCILVGIAGCRLLYIVYSQLLSHPG